MSVRMFDWMLSVYKSTCSVLYLLTYTYFEGRDRGQGWTRTRGMMEERKTGRTRRGQDEEEEVEARDHPSTRPSVWLFVLVFVAVRVFKSLLTLSLSLDFRLIL